MASTYTLNNGIELIGTGEQSGTWGDTTNTNLSLLDTALDGQVTVTLATAGTSGSPNALPISDGSASDGRNRMIIFADGGDLGATAYVQLTPNDAEKIIYIRNDLSGSRSILFFQGTYNASNDYEVPAGTTAVIYFDGGGTGAVAANVFNNAYFDSLRLGSLSVTAILDEDDMSSDSATALATQQSIKAYVDTQVGANNELSEVLANGNTTGGTDISVSSGDDITFADSSKAIFGAGSDLQIYHDGDDSYVTDQGTGRLYLQGTSNVTLTNANGTVEYANFANNGAVSLRYNNDIKFATQSDGVNITGTLTSDGLSVDGGTIKLDGNYPNGTGNVALGDQAGDALITGGNYNVAIGNSALSGITTGDQNIAIGASALQIVTANANTAIGYNSAPVLTTGSVNTGLGGNTFSSLVTGSNNVAIGRDAGLTLGDEIVATDIVSGINYTIQTSGTTDFTLIGAADSNPGTTFTATGAGTGTGTASANASYNTFVGHASSYLMVGGSKNTVLGRFNGNQGTIDIRNSDNNIVLSDGDGNPRLAYVSANTELVINEQSADVDFRVESNTQTHAFFVEGAGKFITFGESDQNATLATKTVVQITGTNSTGVGPELLIHNPGQGGDARSMLSFGNKASDTEGYSANIYTTNNDGLYFATAVASGGFSEGTRRFNIADDGNINFYEDTGTNPRMVWYAAEESLEIGAIETGTNAPLSVKTNGSGHAISIEENSGAETWQIGVDSAGDLNFWNSGQTVTPAHSFFDNYSVVFNEQGQADGDFRVESDNQANMLFVDAGEDRIGIAEGSPDALLQVGGVGDSMKVGRINSTIRGGGQANHNWYKILNLEYLASSFAHTAFRVQIVGNGGTSGEDVHMDFMLFKKQQSTTDRWTLKPFRKHGMDLAYKWDSSGGTYSTGLLELWIAAEGVNYQVYDIRVQDLQANASNSATYGEWQFTDTGSETQPSGSTIVVFPLTGHQTRYTQGGLQNSQFVVNDDSEDVDFRVESNANANMLFVNANADTVHIGSNNGSSVLNLESTGRGGSVIALNILNTDSGSGTNTFFNATNNIDQDFQIKLTEVGASTKAAYIGPSTNTNLILTGAQIGTLNKDLALSSTSIVVNQDSRNLDFRVESDNRSSALFVDADADRVQVAGHFSLDEFGGGITAYRSNQFLTGQGTSAGNAAWFGIVNSGYTAALDVHIIAYQGTPSQVGVWTGKVAIAYGGGVVGLVAERYQGGNITDIEVRYNNTGQDLEMRVTYSGDAPTVYWTVNGASNIVMSNII